jgi:hypothetical protein
MMQRPFTLFFALLLCLSPMAAETGQNRAADVALADARRLTAEGDYAGALERHLWYHDHALESAPSHYGVRLSFALSDWHRLGEKYPPAIEAFRRVRDEKTKRLAEGEEKHDLFHDVAAMNRTLRDHAATAALFRRLDEISPVFASTVVDIAGEALADRGEHALFRKHLGDPQEALDAAKRSLKLGLGYAKSSPDPENARAASERNFTKTVVRLVVTLRETGERETAARIRREALALVDSNMLRESMPD